MLNLPHHIPSEREEEGRGRGRMEREGWGGEREDDRIQLSVA